MEREKCLYNTSYIACGCGWICIYQTEKKQYLYESKERKIEARERTKQTGPTGSPNEQILKIEY